jgi:hypothetical protein
MTSNSQRSVQDGGAERANADPSAASPVTVLVLGGIDDLDGAGPR